MTTPRNVSVATSFSATPDALGLAVAAARQFAAAEGLGDDSAAHLAIIVEELVANLLDHAGLADSDRFGLEMECRDGCVTLVMTDRGRLFDPRGAAPGDLPPERGGGAGLALVKAWAHIDSYTRIGETNRLMLSLPVD